MQTSVVHSPQSRYQTDQSKTTWILYFTFPWKNVSISTENLLPLLGFLMTKYDITYVFNFSVMSYSLWPYGLWHTRIFCPWDCFQTRILEWFAISSSRESSCPRDATHVSWVSCIGRCFVYDCTTLELIIHLSKHTEYTTAGRKFKGNYGRWVIMIY